MPIPFDMTDSEYVKRMLSYETKGIGIYRHLSPERLLNARWKLYKKILWVSDFGGLGIFGKDRSVKLVRPHIAVWHKGKTQVLLFNKTGYFLWEDRNLNVIVPTVTYKLFMNFSENTVFEPSETVIEYYNGLFWDCRIENLSVNNTKRYGMGYDEF